MEGFLHRSLYLQSIFCRCNVFFFFDIWKVASYIWSLKCDIYDGIFSRLCYMMIAVLLLGPPTRFWSCQSQKSFGYLGEWHNSKFIKYDFGKNGGPWPTGSPPAPLPGALLLYNFLLAGETCEFKEGGYGKNFKHTQKKKYLIYLKSVLS